jgi:uncharacterized membrane protein YphA (DoxX/SURF4 family)
MHGITFALFHGAADGNTPASACGLLAVASGAALVAGLLTPIASSLGGVTVFLLTIVWTTHAASALVLSPAAALFVITDAAALLLLGPGAYSLDAVLFGRREILITSDSRRH